MTTLDRLLNLAEITLKDAIKNSEHMAKVGSDLDVNISQAASLLVIARALNQIAERGIPKDRRGRIN